MSRSSARRPLPDRPEATVLQVHLAAGLTKPAGPVDVFRAARRQFLRCQRVDMQALASQLGISRATLYRWVGSREELLGEILWSLAEIGLKEAGEASKARGAERIVQLYERFLAATATHAPIRHFLDTEPDAALRLLTSKHGVQQHRLIEALRLLLEEAVRAGELRLRLDAADLAYVMVRIGESFMWREFITGEEPDLAKASAVVRMLLS